MAKRKGKGASLSDKIKFASKGAFAPPFPAPSAASRIAGGGQKVTEDTPGFNPRTMGNRRSGRRRT